FEAGFFDGFHFFESGTFDADGVPHDGFFDGAPRRIGFGGKRGWKDSRDRNDTDRSLKKVAAIHKLRRVWFRRALPPGGTKQECPSQFAMGTDLPWNSTLVPRSLPGRYRLPYDP